MIKFFVAMMSITKIKDVALYLYEGLVLISSTISATKVEIEKTNPESKYLTQLIQVEMFLSKAILGVELVLRWVGVKNLCRNVGDSKTVVPLSSVTLLQVNQDFEKMLKKHG